MASNVSRLLKSSYFTLNALSNFSKTRLTAALIDPTPSLCGFSWGLPYKSYMPDFVTCTD